MNDTELDEMLNQWDAPTVNKSLREKVRAGFGALRERPRKRWFAWPSWHIGKGLLAGMAAAGVFFLVVIAQAFPQSFGFGGASPALGFPYFVQSQVTVYAEDGSSRIDAIVRSYSYKGMEIVLDEKHPDNPIQEFIKNFHNGVHYTLLRYVPGLVLPESSAKDAWFGAYVKSGCVDKGDVAVGHETILGHATTLIQQTYPDGRWTAWRAPDLGCFTLRTRMEEPLPVGGYRVTRQRDALGVFDRTGHAWQLQAP